MQKENTKINSTHPRDLGGPQGSGICRTKTATTDPRTLRAAKHSGERRRLGFTLIELLVVVLIIGILAAVAVPQYRMAVDKTRLVKLMPLARAVKNAQEAFWLANGRYATAWDELGVDLPSFLTVSGGSAYSYGKNLRITLYGQEYFGIGPYQPDFLFVWTYDNFPSNSSRIACYAYNDYARELQRKLCRIDGKSSSVPYAFEP